jgi:hypothetical protein
VSSEVVLEEEDGVKAVCAVNLHNAVRVAQLSSSRLREICTALAFSLGCDDSR